MSARLSLRIGDHPGSVTTARMYPKRSYVLFNEYKYDEIRVVCCVHTSVDGRRPSGGYAVHRDTETGVLRRQVSGFELTLNQH